jgi:uncharacterized surface protein with fasciclin (FAS1) repeats
MKRLRVTGLFLLLGIIFSECAKEEYIIATTDDVLMGAYFEQESDRFSSFYEMLIKSGTLSFLNAYGTYTCFAPTNDAIDAFLQSKGKNSLDDFTEEELKDLVRYHIIIDTLNSTRFTDGKLPTANMYGQYLTASTFFESGQAKVKINKYAVVEDIDIRVANGIVHGMKNVLEPVTVPIAGLIEADPDLSIFTEALKATGFYDTLSLIPDEDLEAYDKRWFTVFVHTDSVYREEGINSFEDLKSRYSNTGNPKNPEDSLYLYVAYHILDYSLKYIADLVLENAHLTMAPLEVITIKMKQDTVLVNEDEFRGVIEKGSPLNRAVSDNTSANGVFHYAELGFAIKIRLPFPIFWDVCDQPEIRKLPGVFRVPGQNAFLQAGQLANVTWSNNSSIEYQCVAGGVQGEYLVHSDMLVINLRTADINWIEFKTPLIVKGKYKLWICTRNVDDPNRRPIFLVYFNDEALPNIVATDKTLERIPDEELLLQGFKRYNYNIADSTGFLTDYYGRFSGRLAGTIEVPTTGSHTIRFNTINNGDKYLWIDMIHIIPYENDQLWPRVMHDGSLVEKPDWYPVEESSE